MATLRKEVLLSPSVDTVWAAFRDYYAVDRRVAQGFVVKSEPAGEGVRMVTFANGLTVREDLISCDDQRRRLAYTASGGQLRHHNGVFEVRPSGEGALVVWTLDLLPDAMAPAIAAMMDDGCAAMRRTLG